MFDVPLLCISWRLQRNRLPRTPFWRTTFSLRIVVSVVSYHSTHYRRPWKERRLRGTKSELITHSHRPLPVFGVFHRPYRIILISIPYQRRQDLLSSSQTDSSRGSTPSVSWMKRFYFPIQHSSQKRGSRICIPGPTAPFRSRLSFQRHDAQLRL